MANVTKNEKNYSEVAEYAAENGANDTKTEYSIPILDIDATKSGTDAAEIKNSTLNPAGAAKNDVDAAEMQNSATDPVGAAENDADDDGTANAQSDGNSTGVVASKVQHEIVPAHIRGTVEEKEYVLVVLCLCYIMRKKNVTKHYSKIKDVLKLDSEKSKSKESKSVEIESLEDIIDWYKKIVQGKKGDSEDSGKAEILLKNISGLSKAIVIKSWRKLHIVF